MTIMKKTLMAAGAAIIALTALQAPAMAGGKKHHFKHFNYGHHWGHHAYYPKYYGYHKRGCYRYKRKAIKFDSPYWWKKYYRCRAYYY